ncbi:winged helix domain-containing protein [Microvirga sesbaniae]|uniref:winged helix domain-containing protein n=1 Tax=Microvirga sesbaniae TaxID=681392 RepID=UPI00358DB895
MITHNTPHKRGNPFSCRNHEVTGLRARTDDGRELKLSKRLAWMAYILHEAGLRGVTTLEWPGRRLSHYVMCLRRDYGLSIETERERHSGPFEGTHGRYKLHTPLVVMEVIRAGDRAHG